MKPIDLSHNLKSLLLQRFEWIESKQLQTMNQSGIQQQLTLAQGRIFAQLRGKPLSISDLAKRLGVSRQAAQKTVAGLVERGLLELRESEGNMSAKIVHITADGHNFRREIHRVMNKIEKDIAAKIGEDGLALLKELLTHPWD